MTSIGPLKTNNLCINNGVLSNGNLINQLKRWCIPTYASRQDQKIITFFTDNLKKILNGNTTSEFAHESIALAERFLVVQTAEDSKRITGQLSRLEHYVLSAKHHVQPSANLQSEIKQCAIHNKELLAKWKGLGFEEEAFWLRPDLVDFVFKTHLHRYIKHPFFEHTIDTQWNAIRCNGEFRVGKEPFLLMEGTRRPWSEISQVIQLDSSGRLYSLEGGKKVYWMYLNRGFVRWDRNHFVTPHCMRIDPVPPLRTQIQIITTHMPKERQIFVDRVRKGVRHLFFRIHVGEGFAQRNPQVQVVDGGLYSIGWGRLVQDSMSWFRPLKTNLGAWNSPDPYEFIKQDFCVTTLDVSEDRIVNLMQTIGRMNQEVHPFNQVGPNCCTYTSQLLENAGIVSFDVSQHIAPFWGKVLLPRPVWKTSKSIGKYLTSWTPQFIRTALKKISGTAYSLFCAPFFILLGAAKVELPKEGTVKAPVHGLKERIRPFYDRILDLLDPKKASFDMTEKIYKWQKRQPSTVFENHSSY